MARVSVEDCILRIPSPFTLTQIAAKRARQLVRGASSRLPMSDHKATVIALQEIAVGQVTERILSEADLPVVEAPRLEFEPFDVRFK